MKMRTIKSDHEFDILLACKQPNGNFIRIRYGLAPHTLESEKSAEYFKKLIDFKAEISIGTFVNED